MGKPLARNALLEFRQGSFVISTEQSKLDIGTIHGFLKDSYWARNIPFSLVQKSVENSLCFGVYEQETQIGFARVISDYATFAYVADVFILESHRGQGLSKWLMECILKHPELQGLRRWVLATRDAHGLYEKYGFRPLRNPESFMEMQNPDIYQQ